ALGLDRRVDLLVIEVVRRARRVRVLFFLLRRRNLARTIQFARRVHRRRDLARRGLLPLRHAGGLDDLALPIGGGAVELQLERDIDALGRDRRIGLAGEQGGDRVGAVQRRGEHQRRLPPFGFLRVRI